MGYEVVRTGDAAHHATVAVPDDWSFEAASALARIFRHATNPAPKRPH
jgi:hypothetical protein